MRKIKLRPPSNERVAGFSMVEVLVALVVLSVGMLGMAALYVVTLQSGTSAIFRMQAVSLASDLADRIRANPAGANFTGAGTSTDCLTVACNAADMAANDVYVWKQQIAGVLPGTPSELVTYVAGSPETYTINIQWTEPGQSSALSYQLVLQLCPTC
jgi:type IV pilus assembly protein PilV